MPTIFDADPIITPAPTAAAPTGAATAGADVGAAPAGDIFSVDPIVGSAPPTAAPAPGGFWSLIGREAAERAGSFATGANDLLATVAGVPVDLTTGAINLGLAGAERGARALGYDTTLPRITNPVGGSQSLRDALAGTVGRTTPKDALDRVLYGTGGAVMSVPLMGAGGAALAPELPSLAEALVPQGAGQLGRAATIAAGSGAGGGTAREEVSQVTSNPWALAGADILGGAAGGAGTAAALAVPRIAAQIARPLTSGGQQTIAGRLLNQAAGPDVSGGQVQAMAAEPQPAGVQPTLGDLTGNRGLQSVQRAVEAGTPEAGSRAQRIATDNNQQILANFDRIGSPGNRAPYEISQQGAEQLEAIRAQQQKTASDAFKAVPSDQTMVPTSPLLSRYVDYAGSLGPARQRFLPDTYSDLLTGYADTEPLSEIQNFSSALKTDARQAGSGANPDYNRANVLNGLYDALFPEGGPEDLLTPQQGATGDALRDARAQWLDYKQTYSDPAAIKSVLRAGGTPDSAAFDRILGPGVGQAERAAQFVKAAQGDPDLLQNARDWFAAQMRKAGSTSPGKDLDGDPWLNSNQLGKFTRDNQPLIDSGIFDDTHRAAIGDITDAADTVQRTMRANTPQSDTYRNLATGKYLRELGMGPLASAIATVPEASGAAIGAGLGAHLFGAPGAFFGAPAGASIGHMLSFAQPRANVLNLIGRAVNDPTLAGELMSRAAAAPPTPRGISLQDLLAGTTGAAFGR